MSSDRFRRMIPQTEVAYFTQTPVSSGAEIGTSYEHGENRAPMCTCGRGTGLVALGVGVLVALLLGLAALDASDGLSGSPAPLLLGRSAAGVPVPTDADDAPPPATVVSVPVVDDQGVATTDAGGALELMDGVLEHALGTARIDSGGVMRPSDERVLTMRAQLAPLDRRAGFQSPLSELVRALNSSVEGRDAQCTSDPSKVEGLYVHAQCARRLEHRVWCERWYEAACLPFGRELLPPTRRYDPHNKASQARPLHERYVKKKKSITTRRAAQRGSMALAASRSFTISRCPFLLASSSARSLR